MKQNLEKMLKNVAQGAGRITVLTGAGISAESNIPTFRGPEGYWTIGSKEYQPQEMATYEMFTQKPDEVWKWYLYRVGVCKRSEPNAGHLSLVEMEKYFKGRFTLITQNVDNLHLRAGSRSNQTFQIHGNIFYMRCARECALRIYSIPENLIGRGKGDGLTKRDRLLLSCPECGDRARPHVLWFDEAYNEHYYRFNSALKAAAETELLIVVGTSGATNLSNQIAWLVHGRNGSIVDINIEENPFSQLALKSRKGYFIKEPSSTALPRILQTLNEWH
ncbi:NAD-dependent deacetylase [Thermodesulfobacteriota bacterium]